VRAKAFLAFTFVFLIAAAGLASERRLSLDELAREADLIVKASVVDIKTAARGNGILTTLVTLAVEESWKGSPPGPQVTVSVRGGSAGAVAQAVSGEPRFSPGERTIVFLKAKRSSYTVVGGRQGYFAVKSETDGKEVAQDITGDRRAVDNFRAQVEAVRPRH
jgi:hypothetical protein